MADIPVSATGILARFLEAGIISSADFHTAERLAWHCGERSQELAKLALALTMRALRQGSVCLDLATAHTLASETEEPESQAVPWPSLDDFLAALQASPLAQIGTSDSSCRPLRLVGTLSYLERYWRAERDVERSLRLRSASAMTPQPVRIGTLNPAQDRAVTAVGRHPVTVITGGPGTGKTRTAAAIVAAYPGARIALAAPTGKAAARLQESVCAELSGLQLSSPPGTTLHRLLGLHPARPNAPRHDADNPLPFDLVIVDETSMISLTMMRQLLAAVRPDAHLALIGDRDQLASIDAGAVLADLGEAAHLLPGGDSAVVQLEQNYRFGGSILAAAAAIRDGDPEACLAALEPGSGGQAELVETLSTDLSSLPGLRKRLSEWAHGLRQAAEEGDAAEATRVLEAHRLLCAHREGPYGAQRWNRAIADWLAPGQRHRGALWPVGQPLLVTQNAPAGTTSDQVWNGDSGVIVRTPQGPRAAIARGNGPLLVPPAMLDGVAELYAMTIHKSQGSQFDSVSIILPPVGSPLLTRELAYTALTRAKSWVTIYGSAEALAEAIQTPARRASGLARFSPAPPRSR